MTTMEYACKFCGKPGQVEAFPEGFAMIRPEVWIPNLACNRCSDFKVALRKLENSVANACQVLNSCRASLDGEKKNGAETKIRTRIDDFTKRICGITCVHYRVANVWSPDFTQMIVESPNRCRAAIRIYVRGIEKESRTETPNEDDCRRPHND